MSRLGGRAMAAIYVASLSVSLLLLGIVVVIVGVFG